MIDLRMADRPKSLEEWTRILANENLEQGAAARRSALLATTEAETLIHEQRAEIAEDCAFILRRALARAVEDEFNFDFHHNDAGEAYG